MVRIIDSDDENELHPVLKDEVEKILRVQEFYNTFHYAGWGMEGISNEILTLKIDPLEKNRTWIALTFKDLEFDRGLFIDGGDNLTFELNYSCLSMVTVKLSDGNSYWFNIDLPNKLYDDLDRLMDDGKIINHERGYYVVVPYDRYDHRGDLYDILDTIWEHWNSEEVQNQIKEKTDELNNRLIQKELDIIKKSEERISILRNGN